MGESCKPLALKKRMKRALFTGLVAIVGMGVADISLQTEEAPFGIVSYELGFNETTSGAMVASWDHQDHIAAAFSLGLDFLFLVSYSVFIVCLILLVANKRNDESNWPAMIAKGTYLAAFCDGVENVALLKFLLSPSGDLMPQIAGTFASVKFVLLAVALIYLSVTWLKSRRT